MKFLSVSSAVNDIMASVKLEIKEARSVVVVILDNGPRDHRGFDSPLSQNFNFKKLEIGSVKKAEELTELIYGPKPKFDNDEFGITRVRYIEVQLCY